MTNDLLSFDRQSGMNTFASVLSLGDGSVDNENAIIHGVSVITSGIEAKGHDLQVDAVTLKQLHKLATGMKTVPVKTNHGSGADAINGYLTMFRIEGDKLRADWHLLKTFTGTAHVLEMAERMPANLGLSVAFRGDPEKKAGGKKAARAVELVSADLVASPAANPDGLFAAIVDTRKGSMAKTTITQGAPAAAAAEDDTPQWAKDMLASNQAFQEEMRGRIEGIESFNDQLADALGDGEVEEGELPEDEGEGLEPDDGAEGEAAPAGAGGAELRRRDPLTYLERKIQGLERQLRQRDEQEVEDAEETAFAAIEQKATELASANEQLMLENQQMAALLKEYQKGAGKPVSAAPTMFEVAPKGKEPIEGQTEFEARTAELYVEFSKKDGVTEMAAKAQAVRKAVEEDPDRYERHLQKIGVRKGR